MDKTYELLSLTLNVDEEFVNMQIKFLLFFVKSNKLMQGVQKVWKTSNNLKNIIRLKKHVK